MSPSPETPRFLDPAGAQAVEALFAASTDARAGDPSPAGPEASAKLRGLLELLDAPAPGQAQMQSRREALIATTCARASAQRSEGLAGAIQPTAGCPALSASSNELTEAFISGRADGDNAAAALLALLDTQSTPAPERREQVIGRTLQAIQDDIERQGKRLRMSAVRELHVPRGRFSFRDLVASAAAVLIGAAVIWPSIAAMKANANQTECASNLQQAGLGMGLFTGADDQRLPSIDDRAKQPVWWDVGVPHHSHSANLFRLVAGGYTTMHSLSCPCNECAPQKLVNLDERDWRTPDEVSYSYLLFEQVAPRISDKRIKLLLVDKSPVVERARNGETFQIDLNSRNHGGRGQNALMSDLSVRFLTHPVVAGDNIWVPRSLEGRNTDDQDGSISSAPLQGFTLHGTEQPADLSDTFVGP